MQRLSRVSLFIIVLLVAYIAWPLHTAMQIRDAMVSGDVATLTRKIEWESVRASLKASFTPETLARLEADPDAPKPSLWQRVKSVVAPRLAGNVVDRYVTPQNLPVLLGYRRVWRGTLQPVLGREEPKTALADTLFADTVVDRLASFWKRLRRASFLSPGKLVLEVEDKYKTGRHYIGTLELVGWEWKLTALSVTGPGL